jgi:hypothetical protein
MSVIVLSPYRRMFTLIQTATAVAIGIPMGLTPEIRLPIFATGLPMNSLFIAVVMVIAPVAHRGPATASPKQAAGSPLYSLVIAPGPMITSPVAVKLAIVAIGVI